MPKVPDGWVLVPTLENMTDEQAEAIAEAANCCGGIAHSIYQQLLGASPEPDTTDADTRVEDLHPLHLNPNEVIMYGMVIKKENGKISITQRTWHEEPDGPNDRQVDIWWNSNWVPAYFSDIKRGDFFLDVKLGPAMEAGRCFRALSDVCGSAYRGVKSFSLAGAEVHQAPAMKDVGPDLLDTLYIAAIENIMVAEDAKRFPDEPT